ncbi:SpoIID/LytB domain-containing protein [Cryptosporangium phraense]|uniref:SpoIID/LytB domain-containing protein n=1 Tax=Cryptosporangium phraense TaxID=2593070 RepID=A0A545ARY0_9ACTN|nr:SpoIID/LytB domain-containing protein [Cryptosporangium phraense]TQS44001.1 SpoIID/LytB domain-containing protein [Cryptosporangium phraense]
MRLLPALVTAAAVAGALAVGAPADAGVATANAAPASAQGITIYGAGYGHGRGLSQYGAQGAAKKGLTSAQIVAFYYPGTTLAAKGNPSLRVRLSAIDNGHFTLLPTTGSTVSGVVATASGGAKVTLPARAKWHVARSGASYLVQEPVTATTWRTKYTLRAPVTFSGPSTLNIAYSKAKTDCRGGGSVAFAGSLQAVISDGAARYVAKMPIDTYLRGVVASEMPSSWAPAALQAQTIAARTYATAKISASRYYDVIDTQANQCWDGQTSEKASTNAAIKATAGKVLTVKGKAISAEFSSSNGGFTAPGGVGYLVSKADPYTASTVWTRVVTPATLASLDGPQGLTTVTSVKVTKRSGGGRWGGRAETVQLTGTVAGGKPATVSMTATSFRVKLDLKSNYLGFAQ